ncbi:serine/threonine protein kinase [Novipirellula artificiosorum]|uniref:Serine/threonine-protein kinase PknB n=1 Tax=Novipirellula artificiosorum TaxID=2528016 RepID=A0A5C6E1S6_9BACT|nr:serine/threonine protein kinase [Novipirellula artificiosorum]TWU42808.1 Serine/threonine-protein kinase PknB [Novipirellula artificiosorum]
MDAKRYTLVRDLFLAAEELSGADQRAFVVRQAAGDQELVAEVMSLLGEHDAESAKAEGENAIPLQASLGLPPAMPSAVSQPGETERGGETTSPVHAEGKNPAPPKQKKKASASEITQRGAERTHASPRDYDTRRSHDHSSPSQLLFAKKSRRTRRINSGWLWVAAVLPTALVGWWTYRSVEDSVRMALRNELTGVADSVNLVADQFMDNKSQLVESWARQTRIRDCVVELVDLAETRPPIETLKAAPQSDRIHDELQILSGVESVSFIVWNHSFTTIASWLESREDIGQPVAPTGAGDVARALRGETMFFGPERIDDSIEGYVPKTGRPAMACIVPIRDDNDEVIAAMLVSGIQLYEQFNEKLRDAALGNGLDAYAVNPEGMMISESGHAATLYHRGNLEMAPDKIADGLRVTDPGVRLSADTASKIQRRALPLTESVASATQGESDVRLKPYNNYAGESVVGGWRWSSKWHFAVIVEKGVREAFAPARIVWSSFLLLGSLLTVTAFVAASRLARRSLLDHAAVHPLSRYEIVSELGSGGMGVVYKAKHRQLGRDTALKLLRGDRHNKEDRLRFDREAKLAASLSSPHSVMIYDYGRSEEGEAYCVMEYLHGLTLQEVVARSGSQPIGRVLYVLRQVCEALIEAHGMDLVHRDIKPQNIMLSLDASVGDWAVVFDYGLAKPLSPDNSTYQTSEVVWAGTPMYMAPERFRSPTVMDPRSDIYSIGCVAYYLLAGRPPFAECDPESLFALIISEQPIGIGIHRGEEVPESIRGLVYACMSKNADDRYSTVKELGKAIDLLRSEYPWGVEEAVAWWKQHGEDR